MINLEGLYYPVIDASNENETVAAKRKILNVFDLENQAGFGLQLTSRKQLITISYSKAAELIEMQNKLESLPELVEKKENV